jgi:hypothetical protein
MAFQTFDPQQVLEIFESRREISKQGKLEELRDSKRSNHSLVSQQGDFKFSPASSAGTSANLSLDGLSADVRTQDRIQALQPLTVAAKLQQQSAASATAVPPTTDVEDPLMEIALAESRMSSETKAVPPTTDVEDLQMEIALAESRMSSKSKAGETASPATQPATQPATRPATQQGQQPATQQAPQVAAPQVAAPQVAAPQPATQQAPQVAAPQPATAATQSAPQPATAATQSAPQPATAATQSAPQPATAATQSAPQPATAATQSAPQPATAATQSAPQPATAATQSAPQPATAATQSAPQPATAATQSAPQPATAATQSAPQPATAATQSAPQPATAATQPATQQGQQSAPQVAAKPAFRASVRLASPPPQLLKAEPEIQSVGQAAAAAAAAYSDNDPTSTIPVPRSTSQQQVRRSVGVRPTLAQAASGNGKGDPNISFLSGVQTILTRGANNVVAMMANIRTDGSVKNKEFIARFSWEAMMATCRIQPGMAINCSFPSQDHVKFEIMNLPVVENMQEDKINISGCTFKITKTTFDSSRRDISVFAFTPGSGPGKINMTYNGPVNPVHAMFTFAMSTWFLPSIMIPVVA